MTFNILRGRLHPGIKKGWRDNAPLRIVRNWNLMFWFIFERKNILSPQTAIKRISKPFLPRARFVRHFIFAPGQGFTEDLSPVAPAQTFPSSSSA